MDYIQYSTRSKIESCSRRLGMPQPKMKTLRGCLVAGEGRGATPASLAVAATGLLPLIVLVGEEDSLVTTALTDGLDSLGLLLLTRASSAVAVTAGGPTALQVDDVVALADITEELELASDKLTSVLGSSVGVEVRVDVGTGDIDTGADGLLDILSLPDVEGLSDGVRAVVSRALLLDNIDKLPELLRSTEVVHDSLVTDSEELDLIPLSPLGNGIDLLLDLRGLVRAAGSLDEDTDDHVNTVLLASRGDSLEGVTVGRVRSDDLEAGLLEGSNVLVDLVARLALAGRGLIRSVGDTVMVVSTLKVSGVGGLLGSLGLRLGLGGLGRLLVSGRGVGGLLRSRVDGSLRLLRGLGDLAGNLIDWHGSLSLHGGLGLRLGGLVNRLGRLLLRRLGLGSLRNLGGGRNTRLRVGADVDEVGLGDSHNLLRSSVGTRNVAGRDRVDDDGLLLAGLGDRSNGVSASRGANVSGGLDDAGNDTFVLGLLGVGAGDGGSCLNNGGDTAHGVSSSRNLGGLADADGGGLGHGHGSGREGVSAGGRALVLLRGWDGVNLDDLGGGGSNRLGSLVAGDLINRGGLRLSSLLGSDGLLGRLRSRGRVGDDYITCQYIFNGQDQ